MFPCTRIRERGLNAKINEALSLSSVVGKIYSGILVRKVHRVTEGLIGDEQESFRSGRHKRKNVSVCVSGSMVV